MDSSQMLAGLATRVEVDLDNLRSNFRIVRESVKPAQILAVLKADAYGHGAVRVASTLEQAGCTRCAVSTLGEAVQLKKSGIDMDIHVLGVLPISQVERALSEGIIPFIVDLNALAAAEHYSLSLGKRCRVHLKVDTGMGRYGFMPGEIPELIRALSQLRFLEVEGIATHLGCPDDTACSMRQLRILNEAKNAIEDALGRRLLGHSLATMGWLRYRDAVESDLVRIGSLLYGLAHCPIPGDIAVRPVLSLKSVLVQVKEIPPGWHYGYGNNTADRSMRIGICAVGTVDGLMGSSSFSSSVLVCGVRCPVLGVSADAAIVNLDGVRQASVGDEVVFIGEQGGSEISAYEQGKAAGTNYGEMLMKISARVPRIYIQKSRAQTAFS